MKYNYSWSYAGIENQVKEVSRYDLVREYLPYLQILSDSKTIITKNNTLIRVLKISGRDNSNLSADEQGEFSKIRSNLFEFVSSETRLTFYTFRNRLPEAEDKSEVFPNKYAQIISNKWDEQFQDSYVSETYLVLQRRFPEIIKNPENFEIKLNAARKDFAAQVEQVKALLQKFGTSDIDNRNGQELFKFFLTCHNSQIQFLRPSRIVIS